MLNSEVNPGTPHIGVYWMGVTIIMQVISLSTLNQIAAVCTIAAAITTILVNLKRFFKK